MKKFNVETIIQILENAKIRESSDFLREYEINIKHVMDALIDAGFPIDENELLYKYSIDMAAMSCFKHKIGCGVENVALVDCFKILINNEHNSVLITDLSWNQTLEQIVNMLQEN